MTFIGETAVLSSGGLALGAVTIAAVAAPGWLDYYGIAGLITAIGVFIIGVGGFVVSATLQLRKKVEATHHLVNGVADALKKQALELSDAKTEIARLLGEKEGIKMERKEPMIQAVIADKTVLAKDEPGAATKEVAAKPKARMRALAHLRKKTRET